MQNAKFEQMVQAQREFQEALGHGPESFQSAEAKMQYIRDLCLGLHVEVAEFLQELPWKPWRKLQDQEYDKHAAAEELVDILIFVINLWIQLGVYTKGTCADELLKRITQKQIKNSARLTTGRNRRSK